MNLRVFYLTRRGLSDGYLFSCRWIVGNKEWNTLQNATQKAYGGIALSMRILCLRILIEVLIMASLRKRICPTRLSKGK